MLDEAFGAGSEVAARLLKGQFQLAYQEHQLGLKKLGDSIEQRMDPVERSAEKVRQERLEEQERQRREVAEGLMLQEEQEATKQKQQGKPTKKKKGSDGKKRKQEEKERRKQEEAQAQKMAADQRQMALEQANKTKLQQQEEYERQLQIALQQEQMRIEEQIAKADMLKQAVPEQANDQTDCHADLEEAQVLQLSCLSHLHIHSLRLASLVDSPNRLLDHAWCRWPL